jgi:uncharacterized protein
MSGALHSWYSLPDLMSLAERGAVLEGRIELARFARLKDLLHSSDGSAAVRMRFNRRHDDLVVMELECSASLELVCQRCLEPLNFEVNERVEFALAEDEDSRTVLPDDMDLIALGGDRLQPASVVEDELIVSLPLVPKHEVEQNQEN